MTPDEAWVPPEIDPAELVFRIAGGIGPVVRRVANTEQTTFAAFEAAVDAGKSPVLLAVPAKRHTAEVALPSLIDVLADEELEGFAADVHDGLIRVTFDECEDALHAEAAAQESGFRTVLLFVEAP